MTLANGIVHRPSGSSGGTAASTTPPSSGFEEREDNATKGGNRTNTEEEEEEHCHDDARGDVEIPPRPEATPADGEGEEEEVVGSVHSDVSSLDEDEDDEAPPARRVDFSTVHVREYKQTVSANPFCSHGPPVGLDWEYDERDITTLADYELYRPPRRTRRQLAMNGQERRDRLLLCGHDAAEAARKSSRDRRRLGVTVTFLPVFILGEKVVLASQRVMPGKKGNSVADDWSHQDSSSSQSPLDVENGGGILRRSLGSALDSMSVVSLSSWSLNRSVRYNRPSRGSVTEEEPPETNDADDHEHEYALRVDRAQHDRATELVLRSLARPHMRAFHCSWLSFFSAFFMWFAVTPLLGEVKGTLGLTRDEVWLSSLCGTAGTIVMRIIIGPLLEISGARVCMASVLVVSAIPCAMTGLVHSATGLAAVRAFIGISGASFVACQYWTTNMFARDTAGTANALAAGWGNLGGGVAQLVVGGVVFPLLREAYGGDANENSSELAWRTASVVPAVFAIAIAILIYFKSDDTPKGNYRKQVKAGGFLVDSPCTSLATALMNWNVWALMLQYACCFGVEVTMTSFLALYFHEHFGLTTVTSAAIASIFGFMNIFARGLGGLASDACQKRWGMRGRLGCQCAFLVCEGASLCAMASANSLVGAICATIFVSVMVQGTEGTTFGIVPYVSRRNAGSVVGFIGAGGNVGGVVFAAIFRSFSDEKALYLMGAAAGLSSLLSFTVKIKNHTWLLCGKYKSCQHVTARIKKNG